MGSQVRYDRVTNFHFFQYLYAEVLTPDVTVFRDDTFKEVIKVKWGGKVDPNPTGFADLQEEKGNSPFLFLLLPLILPVSPPPPRKMLCEQEGGICKPKSEASGETNIVGTLATLRK